MATIKYASFTVCFAAFQPRAKTNNTLGRVVVIPSAWQTIIVVLAA